jgi:mannose-1-phosphate guanylyltransferase/mannose-1-phosphate guanylyltransferase/mannose-6-phosphate isomerase
MTLTTLDLKVLTERSYKSLKLSKDEILYEPFGRNTGPAIAFLCWALDQRGKGEEVIGVFPADHLISNDEQFELVIKTASKIAAENSIVTLGIRPNRPATGFGYIQINTDIEKAVTTVTPCRVEAFHEKPDVEKAEEYLQGESHCWNAGIFIFKVNEMIRQIKTFEPELWNKISHLKPDLSNLEEVYKGLTPISIDHAIMERIHNLVCVPCDIGWNDLGSWDDVANLSMSKSIAFNNHADVVYEKANNNFVFASNPKMVSLVGVSDLIVVETEDALLITSRGNSQDVKAVVGRVSERNLSAVEDHRFEKRPWGSFAILKNTSAYKSKSIIVDPMSQLSYQSHTHRSEHWIIVKGQGEVVLNDEVLPVKAGDSVFIPVGSKHRMRNNGKEPLEFIEVQTGTYFGEDDISRYEDDYARV